MAPQLCQIYCKLSSKSVQFLNDSEVVKNTQKTFRDTFSGSTTFLWYFKIEKQVDERKKRERKKRT